MQHDQITNTCIALNEYPYIRYYLPSHHPPLGPLAPTQSLLPPPPPEGSSRWRTNLARGAQAREYESAEREYVSKVLAWMVQESLDEYRKQNPDFPVSCAHYSKLEKSNMCQETREEPASRNTHNHGSINGCSSTIGT